MNLSLSLLFTAVSLAIIGCIFVVWGAVLGWFNVDKFNERKVIVGGILMIIGVLFDIVAVITR